MCDGIKQSLSYMIVQVAKAHRQRAQAALSEAGIYVGQEMILMQLWEEDGLALSQIVEKACVQPATITKMISRMEKAGFVERRPDPDDGRAKRIYLTNVGRDLQAQTQLAWADLDADTVKNLTAEEHAALQTLLEKILDGLQEDSVCSPQ